MEKLLHALDARSISGWYHPAMRMQNELIASKEREFALKERVRQNEQSLENTKSGIGENPIVDVLKLNPVETPKIQPENVKNVDNLVQLITDQEQQLDHYRNKLEELTEAYRDACLNCDNLKIIENQFHELTHNLTTSQNETEIILAKTAEKMVAIEKASNKQEKICKFIDNDYQQLKIRYQSTKNYFNHLVYELRQQLINNSSSAIHPQPAIQTKNSTINDADLRRELSFLKFKTSKFTGKMMKIFNDLETDKTLPIDFENLQKLAIIQNNLPIDFITKFEFDQLKTDLKLLQNHNIELNKNNKHLEELLQFTQDQVSILRLGLRIF